MGQSLVSRFAVKVDACCNDNLYQEENEGAKPKAHGLLPVETTIQLSRLESSNTHTPFEIRSVVGIDHSAPLTSLVTASCEERQ